MIERIKQETNYAGDIIYKNIQIKDQTITLIYSEVLASGSDISNMILKNIAKIIDEKITLPEDLFLFFYNSIPGHNVTRIKDYEDLLNKLWNGYTVFFVDENNYFAIETRATLDRGITSSENEISVRGPKDSLTENFNKNLGLIRKRIKSKYLWQDSLEIGKQSKTKVSILYMQNIAEKSLVKEIHRKLQKVNIDGILDCGYLKDYLHEESTIFPTILTTEKPDLAAMALLEGKIVILCDNSPYALILPCFFIDLFHTPDDYYQKPINISFIRIIRLLAFLISILIPAYYIAITTHNHDAITTDLLLNFLSQRLTVPFPALVEALLMTVSFEILRESDMRMASTMGTAVSILGGLVLGDAAVSAGIISPIMIIVIAISAISGLVFTSIELSSAIRYFRIFLMVLASMFGIYGIFLGALFLIIKLSSMHSFHKPYLAPFSPLILSEQEDAFIRINDVNKTKLRNPLLTKKNPVRGRATDEKE
ncbi:MAG: spore germination protein [Bacilli bacterium]|nr:spore germination protein [Bacilli bacterium]